METIQNNKKAVITDAPIQITDVLYGCLNKWYWFVISLAITLGIATFYILRTPPTFTRATEMLIKDNSKGKSVPTDVDGFGDLGLFQSNINISNEQIALRSPAIMYEVVKRLGLDVNYHADGRFHNKVAYGVSLPISVSFVGAAENGSYGFILKVSSEQKLTLSDFTNNGEYFEVNQSVKGSIGDTISSPLGRVVVAKTPYFTDGTECKLYINKVPTSLAVGSYLSRLRIGLKEEKSSVIVLSLTDFVTQRADDILNTVISVYNENWIKDKNQIAISTSTFISERLNVIEQELGHVEDNISSFKSENLLPDVQTASSIYFTESSQMNTQLVGLNNQLYMARYVRNYLTDVVNKNQLLPANSGIEGTNIESQIAAYNTSLLQRNGLVANSSEKNPLVVDMDAALFAMRSAIISAIDNQITVLNEQIKSLQKSEKKATSRLAANPNQAKYLLSVERQQKVKEALYLYLLQKREENELSQAFTAYNTRVITPPNGSFAPATPDKKRIFMIAFVLGLLVPAVVVFIQESFNTKVRGRKDIDGLTVPFIGEIPLYVVRKKGLFKNKPVQVKAIVVHEGKRDIINEAFRVLRTNLEFMAEKGTKSNVMLMTSFNPNSGKTFLTMNIAVSLAVKGKRVVVIDGDMRHASASAYVESPKVGLSSYLGHKIDKISEIIIQDKKNKNLSIIPIGAIPPNPTELLFDSRFEELINTLRDQYDYVLIDCPPIELVADTQIIEKLVDRTIFVVRAGLLHRSMLVELENLYNDKKYKNMCIILNGTVWDGSRCGYKYGYRYGYGSGYYYATSKDKQNYVDSPVHWQEIK